MMQPSWFNRFLRNDQGAVASTYALALIGLVAMAGVGFDYGRLMTLESEMQNAADQAALAAATQLDGRSGAITGAQRAQNAVNNYFANASSAVVNRAQLATGAKELTSVGFTFYESYNGTNDTFGAVATTDATAKVVKVQINGRNLFYALTPIVAVLRQSRTIATDAVAGLESGICKTPPMMVCAPNADFPTTSDVGKGILLQPGSAGMWGPGTFGYLDFGNGATMVKNLLGSNDGTNTCSNGATVTAQQGNIASAPDYLNTRFDIYDSSLTPADCEASGKNCPAASTRKDLVRVEEYLYKKVDSAALPTRPGCSSSATTNTLPGGDKVTVTEWLPASEIPSGAVAEGFPRDTCHQSATSNSNGTCAGGNFGNGVWNLSGYQAAHPAVPTSLTTRYAIYKWERDNAATGLQPTRVATAGGTPTGCNAAGKNCDVTYTNYCAYPQAIKGTYRPTAKDRRLLTVAVVDCSSDTGGAHTFAVNKWMDVFLTEPSWDRNTPYTRKSQIYAEVVGNATKPDGTSGFQYYGRNKAVLLR